ncbi:MAG: 3'-5' exonuclease [Akkermansiaceae bacterium]|nr:3'-5' exonuclease [Akkermansiaceae bacterium]NNM29408.1 3'-5' exonuclease [Akkermansiaceae bacterium]
MTGVPLISESSFAAIDFESAGAARGRTDVPVQIAIAHWSPTESFGRDFVSFLHAGQSITWSAQKVHGITPDDLEDAPTLLSLWPEVKGLLLGRILVAHGHGTEKRFLRAFPGHPFGPWIDTLLLARAAWPDLAEHSLGALCERFGLVASIDERLPGRRFHDALYDSVASLFLLEHLLRELDFSGKSLDLLLRPDLSAWSRLRP